MSISDDLKDREKVVWTLVTTGVALAGAVLINKALDYGWKLATKEDPPNNPASVKTTWGQALLWAAISGIAVGMARVVGHKTAAMGWEEVTGDKAPVDKD